MPRNEAQTRKEPDGFLNEFDHNFVGNNGGQGHRTRQNVRTLERRFKRSH